MRVAFLLFLSFAFLVAKSTIFVADIQSGMKTISFEEVAIVDKRVFSPQDFSNQDLKWQKSANGIFGRIDKSALVKFSLTNNTEKQAELILRHTRPGIDTIHLWVVSNKKVSTKMLGGDRHPLEKRPIYSMNSAFPITIAPQEEIEVLAQITTTGVLDSNFEIFYEKNFLVESKFQVTWWGVFSGILIMLISYNIISFFGTKERAFLIHSAYSFFILLAYTSVYGYLYFLEFTSNYKFIDVLAYFSTGMFMFFHLLYPIYLFRLDKTNKKITLLLKTLALFYGLFAIYFAFGYFNEDLLYHMKYIHTSLIVTISLPLFLSFYILTKRSVGSVFYLISQLFVVLGIIYSILAINTEYVGLSLQAAVFTSIFAALELAFITIGMTNNVSKKIKENELYENIAKLNENYIYMGNYATNIIHQWKNPLDRLGTTVTVMRAYDEEGKIDPIEYKSQLNELQNITDSLKNIALEVNSYIGRDKSFDNFNLKTTISNVVGYLGKDTKGVTIINLDEDAFLKTDQGVLSQILLVLLSNAINIFQQRSVVNPKIVFSLSKKSNGKTLLAVEDNGGGVEKKVVEKIFFPYVTTTGGLGSGLYTAKRMAQEKLNGDLILLKNSSKKAVFVVEIDASF